MNNNEIGLCPNRDQLEQLLSGQTSSSEFSRLEAHLLHCDRCAHEADVLVPSTEVTAMLSRAETQIFRTRESELVEQLIRKVRGMRSSASSEVEQTLIGSGDAASGDVARGQVSDETLHVAGQTVAVDASTVSFLQPARQADELGRLGGYRVLQVLGSGGMGVVFRAEDPKLKRSVALKVMKPAVAADENAKNRFLNEAESTAAIEHDNIVTIYQVGEDAGVPFLAMQLLKGESLQKRLNRVGCLPEPEVIRIGREIADGLHAAHSRGLIHRDIKPDNIWLQEGTDRVKILDFGLVRNNAEDAGLTQSGIVLGTPKYMAPEQARGESVDARCDLFSLGSVLYRLVSGKAPFEGSNLTATLIAVAHEDPKPLAEVAPNVSAGLTDLITGLLSKNRELRPASAADVSLALSGLQKAAETVLNQPLGAANSISCVESTSAQPEVATESSHGSKPPRSRRVAAGFAGFAALILMAVLIIKLRTKDGTIVIELESPVPVAQVEIDGTQVKFQQNDSGKALTLTVPEGTHQLVLKTSEGLSLTTELGSKPVQVAVSETTKVRAWLDTSTAGQANSKDSIAMNVDSSQSRSTTPTDAQQATDHVSTSGEKSPSVWPVGQIPAWAENRATMMSQGDVLPGIVERPATLANISHWNCDTVLPRGGTYSVRYSPDGKWLATGNGDGHVRILDATTRTLHRILPGTGIGHGDIAWSPDSRAIAVAADHGEALRVWTIEGHLEFEVPQKCFSVAWSSDGTKLICGSPVRLDIRDAKGSLLKTLVEGEVTGWQFGCIAASPVSPRFACWHNDGVRVWNLETFSEESTLPVTRPMRANGHCIAWGKKDRIALSVSGGIEIFQPDGTAIKSTDSDSDVAVAWYPDGDRLAVWEYQELSWIDAVSGEQSPPGQRLNIAPQTGPVPTAIDCSPDGHHIAVAASQLAICDAALSMIEYESSLRRMQVAGMSPSPDGTQLALCFDPTFHGIQVWSDEGELQSYEPLTEQWHGSHQIAWSPAGDRIAVATTYGVAIYDRSQSVKRIELTSHTIAWNPDGTRFAIGGLDGQIRIADSDGTIKSELSLSESGPVHVAWSRLDVLVATSETSAYRIEHAGTELRSVKIAEVPADAAVGAGAVWQPDALAVSFPEMGHLDVTDNAAERIRRIDHASAWSPQGNQFLQLIRGHCSLFGVTGQIEVSRGENGSHSYYAGAWHPSKDQVYVGYDQNLLVARNSKDLQVEWSGVLLPASKSLTFDAGGSIKFGDRETLDQEFVYYAVDENSNITMLSPTEVELVTGQELLPFPGRYLDSQYHFAVNVGDSWKPAPLDAFVVPGISRAAFTRPGGVSLNLFIQDTGASIDPSWLLAESAKAQEEKLSATVLEKEVRPIAGRDSMWMVVEGQGTGSAITGNGSVKTTQHWIAIPRETDVLVAMLTCPSRTFKVSQDLFLNAIDSLRLTADSTFSSALKSSRIAETAAGSESVNASDRKPGTDLPVGTLPSTNMQQKSARNNTNGNSGTGIDLSAAQKGDLSGNNVRLSQNNWPDGRLPAWAEDAPRWTELKKGDVLSGIAERPADLKGLDRWNVDTVQARSQINVVRYSPDGRWLATGSHDGHVRIYDAGSMTFHQLLPGVGGNFVIADISWHTDNRRLAVASHGDRSFRIWTVDGELLFEESIPYKAVSWTHDGSRLICGFEQGLDIRNPDGTLQHTLVDSNETWIDAANIAVAPDSQHFVSWQKDGIKIWDAETRELVKTLDIPNLQPCGGYALGWSSQNRISVFMNDGVVVFSPDQSSHRKFPFNSKCAAAWHPDGRRMVIWHGPQLVIYLDTDSGETTPDDKALLVSSCQPTQTTAIDVAPDGERIALAGGQLVVADGQLHKTIYESGPTSFSFRQMCISPDGTQIAATCDSAWNCVRILSSDGVASSEMPLDGLPSTYPNGIAWSPKGNRVAAYSWGCGLWVGEPGKELKKVAGICNSAAWNPDGTMLAVGVQDGHILITDADGRQLQDIDSDETSAAVAWTKTNALVAHMGKKIVRIDPLKSGAAFSILAEVESTPSGYILPTCRPDGHEVWFPIANGGIGVNVEADVKDRVRSNAAFPSAWSPDGKRYAQLVNSHLTTRDSDGVQLLARMENGSHFTGSAAWSQSGDTLFHCYDQSLVCARRAEDLQVKWKAVIAANQESMTFRSSGTIIDGDRETLDSQFIYYAADDAGKVTMMSPTEFELQIGEEILPVPHRYFDAEYGFALTTDDSWKPVPLETLTAPVPGITRAAFSRPGGVSLTLFVEETGAEVDASWLLAEKVKHVEGTVSAKTLQKEVRQVAGRNAIWLIVEGQGTGSVLDGKGPVKTTQHWVAIPREKDVLIAMLTSPSGTFAVNQALFLKAIETLTLRSAGKKP